MKVHMDWRTGFLVAIWFLVGVIIFVITKDWQIVAAIATWLLAGGLIFAILQVQQARRSTNAQLAVELFRELRSIKTLNGLHLIYSLKPEKFENLSKEAIDQIEYVVNRLNMIGALVANGIIDERLAIEAFAGAPALRCWYQLYEHYIKENQHNRGFYCENYEGFARRSLDYFRDANKQIWFHREGEEDRKIELITELQQDVLRPRNLEEIKRERKITRKEK